jgi:hypothetical protein
MKKPALFALAPRETAVVIAGCGGSGGSASQSKPVASTVGGTTPTVGLPFSEDINQVGALWYVLTVNGMEIHHG